MKRYLYIIIPLILTVSSCTSFLNVEQLGKNTIEGFFATPDGLSSAGIGLHRALLEYYDDEYIKLAELQGDNLDVLRANCNEANLLVYDFESEEAHDAGHPYSAWNKGYDVITNANEILKYAPKLLEKYPAKEDLVQQELGYAYFVRAVMTFNLTNIYGQAYDYTPDASHLGVVPVDRIPGFDDALPRKSVGECYDFIISDLHKSVEAFGNDDIPSVYYVSAPAAKAMLARVYLYKKDYVNAAKYAKEIMDRFELVPREKYVDMFRRASSTVGECIFRLNTYDAGSGMRSFCDPTGLQDARPDAAFTATFEDNDIRKELFTFVGEAEDKEYEGKEYSAICKYLPYKGGITDEANRRWDYPVLRVSEMYLIHAEALCLGPEKNLEEAAADIKALRARALGVSPSEISLNYSSAGELDRIIAQERAKELCYEGHRFFDLKRRHEDIVRPENTSSKLVRLNYPHYRYVLPIAHLEMQANDSMIQNENY
ncbi:MAG: RagB/SusD family nutrient uptake outer membrane protein [Candidatus Cryptobacteroides sp.]